MTPPSIAGTAEAGVPEKTDEPRVLEHAYDGIREYDNPLPGWWRAIFWMTIVFAAGYWVWFHVGGWGNMPDAKYRVALAEYTEQKGQREAAEARDVSEESLARMAHDPKAVEHGQAIFASRCVSCHTEDGHGLIGPNLTDRYQLHGTTRMDIFKTIRGGVSGTAMLAWGEQMPASDIVNVAAFVTTLRGKDIPGKEPQGQPVEPFK
ncbi:MAG TPA: cbb3-type cytochrome c oxidase N-terminal domain-containing protein [Kofleriaceae bacterium]|nr:cbb3-type cytochrome c oxidase N-terminal domain-containing protein [Kofleriaceae bacterium]